jgi:hypothetical protein
MAFHVAEEALLKRFGGKLVTMPIPTAVLVAARLREGLLGDLMFDAATFLEHMGRLPWFVVSAVKTGVVIPYVSQRLKRRPTR